MEFKSNNPVLKKAFDRNSGSARVGTTTDRMTVSGAINKTGILFVLLCASAFVSWDYASQTGGLPIIISSIIGFIIAIVLSRNVTMAPTLAPIYALTEGVAIGGISALYDRAYPGVVMNAALLTFASLFFMLGLYHFRIIKVTDKLKGGIVMATCAVALVYFVDILLGLFGVAVPFIHSSGPLGIGISVVILGIACMNLLLDFDLVEQGANSQAPKYMEWYSGFALLVTLVWVYLEILRLLSRLNKK